MSHRTYPLYFDQVEISEELPT